jgi:hypothetical protein
MRLVILGVVAFLLQSPAPALRILVIDGDGAVNLIQQKTAVSPLVEVRDRNNLPVAGAVVTFRLAGRSPALFAGGSRTLTVTSNAAGRAAAGGLQSTGAGTYEIQVEASYQGQVATATISQSNVARVVSGGGISAATIGIVGAALAGGAVAATQVAGDMYANDSDDVVTFTTYTGPFSSQIVVTSTTISRNGTTNCRTTLSYTGSLRITLPSDNSAANADAEGNMQEVSVTGSPGCTAWNPNGRVGFNGVTVTGGPSNPSFLVQNNVTTGSNSDVTTLKFNGTLNGDTITGTFGYETSSRATIQDNATTESSGSTTMNVTLRK